MSETVLSLQKARESIQVCPSADKRLERVELRKRQLAHTRTELASVFPVEGTTGREVIQQRIELLKRTINDPTFEERYPYLNMEVLGWRNEQGLPKLAPFSLTDPLFSIKADYDQDRKTQWQVGGSIQRLPRPMTNLYDDIPERFHDEFREGARENNGLLSAGWRKNITRLNDEFREGARGNDGLRVAGWRKSITSRFNGVIPQWVRERIQQASADFSVSTPRVEIKKVGWLRKRKVTKTDITTNIFLIVEADKWVVNQEVVLRHDPLVVGYKAGCLWFICSFDETPLESYVRMEFTV